MLFVQGLGAPMSSLTTLKEHVDKCLRWMPITGADDIAASEAVTCAGWVGGSSGMGEGIREFEKVTLIDDADNALLFNIATTLLTNWRNTDMGPSKSRSEDNVRRIAAQKLGEESVYRTSPTLAAQTLSSNGRIETVNTVKLAIVNSLYQILKTQKAIPKQVRAEAMTTLRYLSNIDDYPNTDLDVINAAGSAVRDLEPKLDIGPVTILPTSKPRSPYLIPIVATATTAVLATGVLVFMFHRRRPSAHALRGVGPLRRRAEAALQRRRGR